jgi:NAD(P)-dependent dehydrogenase (short-subunit alcohol dehydrogenase family)
MNAGTEHSGPSFHGKHVLVVGATSGIGLGIARAFAQANAQVVATGASDSEVVAASVHSGDMLAFSKLNVGSDEGVASFFKDIERLDVLVNCAGIIRRGQEHSPDAFADVIDINLVGVMRTVSAAIPLLSHSRGCVINTASMLSFFGGGLVPAYSASKGGVAQLTKSLAIAHAAAGVRVNAIAPGWIATPLTQALQDDPERSKAILGRTPMARWGTPEDVAGPTLFLASEAAKFVTGVILPVDGGYLIT